MINRSLTKFALALAVGAFASVAQAKPTLKEVTDATEAAAAKAPGKAADIVEEKVKATPEYACPIIKAAIKGAKLHKEDEASLVSAALKAAPEKAPEIRACLASQVVGGGAPEQPVDEEGPDDDSDWNLYRGVVGTYLSTPAAGGAGTSTSGNGNGSGTTTTVTVTEETPGRVIRQVVEVPASGS